MPKGNGGSDGETTPGTHLLPAGDADVRLGPVAADNARLCIKAAELRSRSMTYTEIARALNIATPALAKKAIDQGLALVPSENISGVRRLSDQKIDRVERGLLHLIENPGPLVSQGKIMVNEATGEPYPDQMVQVRAYEALLKADAERRKLWGANAPSRQVNITGEMIAARIAELKGQLGVEDQAVADEAERWFKGEDS